MQIPMMTVASLVALMALSVPARAHHSNFAYQLGEIITLSGSVTEWRWSNPHTWLFMTVETVALTTKSYIDGSSPHSDQMTVHERIRFIEPGILEDRITVNDPEALVEPWEMVWTYQKAEYPNDELREFACAEGLRDSPQ